MKILIVEDDVALSEQIQDCLRRENLVVESTTSGADALQLIQWNSYDAIVLDWNLPDISGISVLREFRLSGIETPLLMLTGKDATDDKVLGLSTGADDYLIKPFDMRELIARVEALLRRDRSTKSQTITIGTLTLDTKVCRAIANGTVLQLRPKEYDLLEFFMRHPDRFFTSDALLARLWSSDSETTGAAVRTWIYRLRSKLPEETGIPKITNAVGQGYMLETPTIETSS